MSIVPQKDFNYLAQQSIEKLNMTIAGMTSLMSDIDNKVAAMESQNWFQRMVKTVSGKNKLTREEIKENHDKLNMYMAEAISALYDNGYMHQEVIMSLGTKINELYMDHCQFKQIFHAFVEKLNEKIVSIDNFHMLTTEINQGVYNTVVPMGAICKILSQLDERTLKDQRKLDIIKRSLADQGIINHIPVELSVLLKSILEIPVDEAGQVYLELQVICDNFFANIMMGIMERYHFRPNMEREMLNKDVLIKKIMEENSLDADKKLTLTNIYDNFLENKIDINSGLFTRASAPVTAFISSAESLHSIEKVQINTSCEEAERLYMECKMDEAFELFKESAESGNPRAMFFLSEFYENQYGHVPKDTKKAMQWRRKGYESGDMLASLHMAYTMPKESNERRMLIDKYFGEIFQSANDGDAFAQYQLAKIFFEGYESMQDEKEGLRWLEKSAKEGFWAAIDDIGDVFYSDEEADEEDGRIAVQWFEKGMEKGYSHSYCKMAYCFLMGIGVCENKLRALELFKEAYELGCGDAAWMIGIMYYRGDGVHVDDKQVFQWFRRSAELGCAEGQSNLGDCYYYGKGTQQDWSAAKHWYKLASDGGNDDATVQLGDVAMEENDDVQAVAWFRMAAERGYADAQNRLGLCYDNGTGVEQDAYEAFKWYQKAAEQENKAALYNLGLCYFNGDAVPENTSKAMELFLKSYKLGSGEAAKVIGVMYRDGQGVQCDAAQALYWFQRSAEMGCMEGQSCLGDCYYRGVGVEGDYEAAKHWYQLASNDGYDYATTQLGILAKEEKRYMLAVKYFRTAAENGYADAQYRLGECYYEGEGVEKDAGKALDCYMKAAEQEHAVAQFVIGMWYEYGEYVNKDLETARKWYERSAENGLDIAKQHLEEEEGIIDGIFRGLGNFIGYFLDD